MGRFVRIGVSALMAATLLGAAPQAFADKAPGSGGREVIKTGACSMRGDWKLKVKTDNGRLEVQFEVDTDVNGQTFNVVLKDNGTVFFRGQRTTQPPSGSFEVTKFTANRAGTDHIVARATNVAGGNTCRGVVDF